mmetsp:Transcript_13512/g.19359  ORF Transcript_13512/g.19359 Transcript_13512/m.19359 type:complete len:154 (+) Transcript_13512:69-530(+)
MGGHAQRWLQATFRAKAADVNGMRFSLADRHSVGGRQSTKQVERGQSVRYLPSSLCASFARLCSNMSCSVLQCSEWLGPSRATPMYYHERNVIQIAACLPTCQKHSGCHFDVDLSLFLSSRCIFIRIVSCTFSVSYSKSMKLLSTHSLLGSTL